MPKRFCDIFKIIYIRGFFENGSIGRDKYQSKPWFLLNLLKGSVSYPEDIRVTSSALNGYIGGNSMDSIIEDLIKAEFKKELLMDHIKGLYPTKHMDSKTYNNRYEKMNYGEALYQKASNEFEGMTMENMADILANEIYTSIIEDKDTISLPPANRHIDSYIFKEDEKTAIKNLCRAISTSLNKLHEPAHKINVLLSIIRNNVNDDKESDWIVDLKLSVKKNQEFYYKEHKELKEHCTAVLSILKPKYTMDDSLKNIHTIADNFCKDRYFFTEDNFNYNALENVRTEFEENYKSLVAYLDAI